MKYPLLIEISKCTSETLAPDRRIAQCECVLKKIDEKANPHHFNFNEGDFNAVFVKENREESIGFSLTNDEYEMFFSSRNIMFNMRQDDKRYDAKLIANEIWKKWLTQIGIDVF